MDMFDDYDFKVSFRGYEREYVKDLLEEKDKLIELQDRDIDALKREISCLKEQLNYSKQKKK